MAVKHVRKGDRVVVTSGDNKGRAGEVIRVDPKGDRVWIKGINLRTKHLRPTRLNPQGGVVTREAPVHISNVSPEVGGRPTRVRVRINDDGSKSRIAARTGEVIPVRLPDGKTVEAYRSAR